jgi:uncharacterized protein (TIGR02646 family)
MQDATYEDFREMDELRQALVEEQRGLCCYCTRPIQPVHDRMNVEHWRSRARYPELALDYKNLLGACRGGVGSPRHSQHCDTFKGAKRLSRNPAHRDDRVEQRIFYTPDGTIRSTDPTLDDDLNTVLNLNTKQLRKDRQNVISALLSAWRLRQQPREQFTQARLAKLSTAEGVLPSYAPLRAWWLAHKGWQDLP